MKKMISVLTLLIFWGSTLFSQRVIEFKYDQDASGNYQFYSFNHAFCNYILEVNFTSLVNVKPNPILPFRAEIRPGKDKLFKLLKENANSPMQFKYTIKYNKGCINPTVKTDFIYLLPISPDKEAQAYELLNREKTNAADPEAKNWYVIRLRMRPGDTIYAARRGTITEVEDKSNLNDSGVTSIGYENYLEIVHGDCSFARYGVLKRNSALVKPGQFVEAGTPIGLVGGDRFGRGSDIRFSVYYNQELEDSLGGGIRKLYWVYVPLKFWTKKNGKGMLKHGASFTSEFPESIITQEMTKLEIKNWKTKRRTGKTG
jgi:hypothetical protein